MPHIKLQYTNNITEKIDFDALFAKIHLTLAEIGGINIDNCKSRAIALDTFFIAEGNTNEGFIHLELKLLEGRSPELKKRIGKKLLKDIKKMYTASPSIQKLQITIEIVDIIKENYFKY